MQTLGLASLAEAAAGEHRSAANTLRRVADHGMGELQYELRAYVSACGAAAIQFAKAGDLHEARQMLRTALPWAKLLHPRDKVLNSAQRLIRTAKKRDKT
jgi:hypothetical protein